MLERFKPGAKAMGTQSSVLPQPAVAESSWRPWLRRWVFKGVPAGKSRVRLRYRRLYILPTRNGALFAAMLVAMWLGGINYNNSMIYLLTFLLSSIAIVSILHTFRNLIGLEVTPLPAEPVFAGEVARFPLKITNAQHRPRTAIGLQYKGELQGLADVPANGSAQLALQLQSHRRGRLRADRCALITIFPTGLFRAWSWLDLELSCLVYPAPETGAVPAPPEGPGREAGPRRGSGLEDFQGLRDYRPGDSLRHVAWRRAGRDETLQIKQFAGEAQGRIWLDWHSLTLPEVEARLSRLCRWVIDADSGKRLYGLRLPGIEIPPNRGPEHRRRCLEALATYGL